MPIHLAFRLSRRRAGIAAVAALALATTALPATAQQAYPNRPITLVHPYAAGGSADSLARGLAHQLEQRLGHTVHQYSMQPPVTLSSGTTTRVFANDTVATKWIYKLAWERAQRCLIPAAIYEPDHRPESKAMNGRRALSTRFTEASGDTMMIAGLWGQYRNAAGEICKSYTMLTINADTHPLLQLYHRPEDEKRMIVILPQGVWEEWLEAPVEEARHLLQHFPAERLVATPEIKRGGQKLYQFVSPPSKTNSLAENGVGLIRFLWRIDMSPAMFHKSRYSASSQFPLPFLRETRINTMWFNSKFRQY